MIKTDVVLVGDGAGAEVVGGNLLAVLDPHAGGDMKAADVESL